MSYIDGVSHSPDVAKAALETRLLLPKPQAEPTSHAYPKEQIPFAGWKNYGNVVQSVLCLVVLCVLAVGGVWVYTFVFNLGSKGPIGDTGQKGATGDTGAQGLPGTRGGQGLPGQQGSQGIQGDVGNQGPLGPRGFGCYDENENGICDPSEDKDGGGCSINDCRGVPGYQGPQGDQGEQGIQGPPGPGGGVDCWDFDGSKNCTTTYPICNVSRELVKDKDCNNRCDWQDCVGFDCWDLNQNHVCDPWEDITGDGNCTAADCTGLRGFNGTQGIQGDKGDTGLQGGVGLTGAIGRRGQMCWDKNDDGICQRFCTLPAPSGVPINSSNEDTNCDGTCDWLDCKGDTGAQGLKGDRGLNGSCMQGIQGPIGFNGSQGEQGPQGYHVSAPCWDLDFNGLCNLTLEDRNGDGNCTLEDCHSIVQAGYFGITLNDANNVGISSVLTGSLTITPFVGGATTIPYASRCVWSRTNVYMDMQCVISANLVINQTYYRIYFDVPTTVSYRGTSTYDPNNQTMGYVSFVEFSPAFLLSNNAFLLNTEHGRMRPRAYAVNATRWYTQFGESIVWAASVVNPWPIEVHFRVTYKYDYRFG